MTPEQRLNAPFQKTKNFQATHRHRKAPSQTVMVLDRVLGQVRYDTGCPIGHWGVEPEDYFDAHWEPIEEEPCGILGLFGE